MVRKPKKKEEKAHISVNAVFLSAEFSNHRTTSYHAVNRIKAGEAAHHCAHESLIRREQQLRFRKSARLFPMKYDRLPKKSVTPHRYGSEDNSG